ncbi:PREDICTED: uncharacterized protein LOC100639693 isoform X1 [Amphimedon queenslandica]|uniref:LolA-like domain-containing protein n=1 Tax=Amphimedon queenslandica TaxID=400682 RepID=A0AAN0J3X5_AMPQE|nr:PREDICTED: uncharacterized protein LOC100639693 isoform X1 [Amphimedon queenslandica]|eukprot:XP_019851446.1 PREDICTED: uncharacterized protein LOC100639693 isoform X1 [Amphimedon queenslandica]
MGEIFIFPNPRTQDDCTVSLLNTNNTFARFFFGVVPGPNNTVHIGPPSALFGLNNTVNYTYMGIRFARGIPCHHWWTCTNRENASFTLEYYFTDSDLWTAPYPQDDGYGYVPVLVELHGNITDRRTREERMTHHHYNFLDFRSGPDAVPDSAFNVPFDLVCKGRLPGQPLPQFPDVFSFNAETVYDGTAASTHQEYYDYTHQLFRVDGYTSMKSPNSDIGPFSTVHDFQTGIQYFLPQINGTCSMQPLNDDNTVFDSTRDESGHFHLRNVSSFLLFGSPDQFVYEGVTTVRGMMVDVWQSYRDQQTIYKGNFTSVTYMLYITKRGMTHTDSVFGNTSDPVLVQTKFSAVLNIPGYGTRNLSTVSSVFGMSFSESPLDVFATLSCFSPSDYRMVQFRLPVNVNPANQALFRSNVRSAFIKYADSAGMSFVSPLQVNTIQVDTQSIPNATVVSLYITNVPPNATQQWTSTPQAFVFRLLGGLSNGDNLPFTIMFDGSPVINAQPVYYIDTIVPSNCPAPTTATVTATVTATTTVYVTALVSPSSSNTPLPIWAGNIGAIAGAGSGLLIFGLIVGALVTLVLCCILQRCKSTGGYSPLVAKYE